MFSFLPQDAVITLSHLKQPYEVDWRGRFSQASVAVLFPSSTKEVQQIIEECIWRKFVITTQGGNTSTCGGAVPSQNGRSHVIVNLQRMNKIIELDEDNYSVTVEAGCTLQQVQNMADQHGLYFPLSMGSEGSCQIGGNISTNAGGVHVIKYGNMRDLTLGLEAVLANGMLINQLFSLRKNNTNFDLKQLLIGSEGTLGIITKASLKLFAEPAGRITILIGISHLSQALDLLRQLKSYYSVSAFEIVNTVTQEIYNCHFPHQPFPLQNHWLIIIDIEYTYAEMCDGLCGASGIEECIIQLLMQQLIDANQVVIAKNEHQCRLLWKMRESIPLAEKMEGFALKHDLSLPISQIEAFIQINAKTLDTLEFKYKVIIFGHLGDGNLHYNVVADNPELLKDQEELVNALVYSDVVACGGSYSAEHGLGQLKNKWYKRFCDSNSYELGKSIKNLIDPDNMLNPGKIF